MKPHRIVINKHLKCADVENKALFTHNKATPALGWNISSTDKNCSLLKAFKHDAFWKQGQYLTGDWTLFCKFELFAEEATAGLWRVYVSYKSKEVTIPQYKAMTWLQMEYCTQLFMDCKKRY